MTYLNSFTTYLVHSENGAELCCPMRRFDAQVWRLLHKSYVFWCNFLVFLIFMNRILYNLSFRINYVICQLPDIIFKILLFSRIFLTRVIIRVLSE